MVWEDGMTLTTARATRIANIVETLFRDREFLRDRLDRVKSTQEMIDIFGKFSPEELQAISDNDLTKRINNILTVDSVAGMLNDLTPEQIRMFDEAVEGR